jgi:hypothetical protein
MSETQLIAIAGAVLAAMFGLLTAILGWIGSKMYAKMEEISRTMHDIAGDLHERINDLDRRVTVVETVQHTHSRKG